MSIRLSLWLVALSYSMPLSNDSDGAGPNLVQLSGLNLSGGVQDVNGLYNLPHSAASLVRKVRLLRRTLRKSDKGFGQRDIGALDRFFYYYGLNPLDPVEHVDPAQRNTSLAQENIDHENRRMSTSTYPTTDYKLYEMCHRRTAFADKPLTMISSCPDDFPDVRLRTMCETHLFQAGLNLKNYAKSLQSLPVADSHSNVFANRFCASCHNVIRYQTWRFTFECEAREIEQLLSTSDDEGINGHLSGCSVSAVLPFSSDKQSCHDLNSRSKRGTRNPSGESSDYDIPVSFSVLMNFGFDGKAHILFTEAHHIISIPPGVTCPHNQIFDPEKRKCRPVVCGSGYVLKDQQCVVISPATTTPDPLIDNGEIVDDIAQVSLEVNVDINDYAMLFSKDFPSLMKKELGSLFNISVSRIQHFKIQPLQGPGSGTILQIHKYNPSSHTHPKKDSRRSRKHSSHESAINHTSRVNISQYINSRRILNSVINLMNTSSKLTNETDNATASNSSVSNVTSDHETTITSPKNTSTTEAYATEDGQSTSPTHAHRHSIVVRISFLLFPPPVEAKTEKSVDKAVEEMVNHESFKVNVSNTHIIVASVINEGEPSDMSDWCKHGIVNAYDDKQFLLGFTYNNETGENETFVFVNETGFAYRTGDFDLTVLMEGTLFNSQGPRFSGYAFVCTMPRVLDPACSHFTLKQREFRVINHEKAMADIYTNTTRSIFEYQWVTNDSVEICTPVLANKTCGRIKLCESEYTMLENKSVLYYGDLYTVFQYQAVENGAIEICIPPNYFGGGLNSNITDHVTGCDLVDYTGWLRAEAYLTVILSVISICSMTVVLVTYCLFPILRNLPGTNTMNLVMALLVAELVFEFGSSASVRGTCVAVGVILHFFFLASFFWMNVMAYDVYRTFANTCVLTRVRSKGKYAPRYSLYAWGSPGIIVLGCCFIDFSGLFETVRIGYGSQDYNLVQDINVTSGSVNDSTHIPAFQHHARLGCWIQEPMAALAAFGGPILVILIANAVFYIKAIVCIRATTRSSVKHTRRSSQRRLTGQNDVMIYVRMSMVMGFTWIIGFTSSFISSVAPEGGAVVCHVLRVLTILFTLFNCSQGFLIFFVFVLNRRVGQLYKQLLWRKLFACKKYVHERRAHIPATGVSTVNRGY